MTTRHSSGEHAIRAPATERDVVAEDVHFAGVQRGVEVVVLAVVVADVVVHDLAAGGFFQPIQAAQDRAFAAAARPEPPSEDRGDFEQGAKTPKEVRASEPEPEPEPTPEPEPEPTPEPEPDLWSIRATSTGGGHEP